MTLRLFPIAAALMLFAAPACAQSTTPNTMAPGSGAPAAPTTTAPTGASSALPDTPAPAASSHHKHSQTLQQRFDAANTSHDGRLTKDQAVAAKWGYVTSHFSSIDKNHNGYVTVDDIRSYSKARRATHHKSTTTPAPAPATTSPATNG